MFWRHHKDEAKRGGGAGNGGLGWVTAAIEDIKRKEKRNVDREVENKASRQGRCVEGARVEDDEPVEGVMVRV